MKEWATLLIAFTIIETGRCYHTFLGGQTPYTQLGCWDENAPVATLDLENLTIDSGVINQAEAVVTACFHHALREGKSLFVVSEDNPTAEWYCRTSTDTSAVDTDIESSAPCTDVSRAYIVSLEGTHFDTVSLAEERIRCEGYQSCSECTIDDDCTWHEARAVYPKEGMGELKFSNQQSVPPHTPPSWDLECEVRYGWNGACKPFENDEVLIVIPTVDQESQEGTGMVRRQSREPGTCVIEFEKSDGAWPGIPAFGGPSVGDEIVIANSYHYSILDLGGPLRLQSLDSACDDVEEMVDSDIPRRLHNSWLPFHWKTSLPRPVYRTTSTEDASLYDLQGLPGNTAFDTPTSYDFWFIQDRAEMETTNGKTFSFDSGKEVYPFIFRPRMEVVLSPTAIPSNVFYERSVVVVDGITSLEIDTIVPSTGSYYLWAIECPHWKTRFQPTFVTTEAHADETAPFLISGGYDHPSLPSSPVVTTVNIRGQRISALPMDAPIPSTTAWLTSIYPGYELRFDTTDSKAAWVVDVREDALTVEWQGAAVNGDVDVAILVVPNPRRHCLDMGDCQPTRMNPFRPFPAGFSITVADASEVSQLEIGEGYDGIISELAPWPACLGFGLKDPPSSTQKKYSYGFRVVCPPHDAVRISHWYEDASGQVLVYSHDELAGSYEAESAFLMVPNFPVLTWALTTETATATVPDWFDSSFIRSGDSAMGFVMGDSLGYNGKPFGLTVESVTVNQIVLNLDIARTGSAPLPASLSGDVDTLYVLFTPSVYHAQRSEGFHSDTDGWASAHTFEPLDWACPLATSRIPVQQSQLLPQGSTSYYFIQPRHSYMDTYVSIAPSSSERYFNLKVFAKSVSRSGTSHPSSNDFEFTSTSESSPWRLLLPAGIVTCRHFAQTVYSDSQDADIVSQLCDRWIIAFEAEERVFPFLVDIVTREAPNFQSFDCDEVGSGVMNIDTDAERCKALGWEGFEEGGIDGSAIRLTESDSNTFGHYWYNQPLRLRNGFEIQFSFEIYNPTAVSACDDADISFCSGGEGLALVISPTLYDGTSGSASDIYGNIGPGVAIEFDPRGSVSDPKLGITYEITTTAVVEDKRSPHVAVLATSLNLESTDHVAVTSLPTEKTFADSQLHSVVVRYFPLADGTGRLWVYLDDDMVPVLANVLITSDIVSNVLTSSSGDPYVGFVASNSADGAHAHKIYSFRFCYTPGCSPQAVPLS